MKNVVLAGATSAIAQETARIFARRGASFVLVGRNVQKLEAVQKDLEVRGADTVSVIEQDLSSASLHEGLFAKCVELMPNMDILLVAWGSLGSQEDGQMHQATAREILDVNFVSVASLLTPFANHFETRKSGKIGVISSVAGDRGRKSNYVYGSAKAGLDAFLSGLRNRLARSKVQVLTVKPGFVDTPMTAHLKKGILFASPSRVARDIVIGLRRNRSVIYTPWFWRPIMTIIRSIPEPIFKRLSL